MAITDVRKLSPLDIFLYWIRERHAIHLKRQEECRDRGPMTILQDNFFTNPYREHDKTTVWFRETVREPMRDDPRVVFATVAWRWFNLISTGEILRERGWLLDWNEADVVAELGPRRDRGEQIFTGAFMANSPGGEPKLEAICRRISNVWNRRKHLLLLARSWSRMSEAHTDLLRYQGARRIHGVPRLSATFAIRAFSSTPRTS